MVQRASERLGIDSGGQSAIAVQGPQRDQPQIQQGVFDTQLAGVQTPVPNAAPINVQNQEQILDPMVQAVLQLAPKVADSMFKRGTEEAYLNGAAAAGAGIAEGELAGNPLTRAWGTAGYKDTVGRMAMADYEANVVKDLAQWKEKSPAEYTAYLAQKRAELLPQLDSMSLEARSNVFKQLLTSERASIAKHTKVYSDFVVDTTSRGLQAGMSVMNAKMDAARDNPDAYATARDATFAHTMSNIWFNQSLPRDVRDKLMEEQVSYALEKGHTDLYKLFDTFPVVDKPDGTRATVLSQLPLDMQTKLHKQYVTAWNADSVNRNAEWNSQFTQALISSHDPFAKKIAFSDFQALVNMGVQSKAITPEQGRSALVNYSQTIAKTNREGVIANMTTTGDVQGMALMDASQKDGVDALVNTETKAGKPVHVIMDTLRDVGIRTGNRAAMTKFGEILEPAISSLMTNETDQISPSLAKVLATYTSSLDRAKMEGAVHFKSTVLAALPEEQRLFLTRLTANMEDKHLPIEQAIRKTRDAQIEDNALPPAARAARASAHAKENQDAANSLEEMHMFSGLWNSVKGAVGSPIAKAEGKLLPKAGPFGWGMDDQVSSAIVAQYRSEYLIEANNISLTNPSMTANARDELARANIAQRVIPVGGRAMILPRGVSVNSFFGAGSGSADPERIGAAIDTLIKPSTQGGSLQFSVRDGKLMYTEITERGQTIPGGFIDPKDVGKAIEDKRIEEAKLANKTHGAGEVVSQSYTLPNGMKAEAKVRFNGDNTAGIDNQWAFEIRKSLVQFEGVRAHKYEDGKGPKGEQKYSVGVGVNSGNPDFYPKLDANGVATYEAISTSFAGASNQAMRLAANTAARVGLQNLDAYEMLTHMIYQNPAVASATSNSTNAKFLESLVARNPDAAVTALRKTPAYSSAGADRQKWYEDKVRKMLNQ